MSNLVNHINEYLHAGGLFHPELANHEAVRDLLINCKDRIEELQRMIANNCDPYDATVEDAKVIQECFYIVYPENQ
jgi:hypothetical protein